MSPKVVGLLKIFGKFHNASIDAEDDLPMLPLAHIGGWFTVYLLFIL
ncbi:MAG: hypothetical protein NTV43_13390 [Methylococcales bacterium]|nr:hypothetical protein [Methylococcales bacterium]